MLPPTFQSVFDERFKVLRIIWLAFVTATPLYVLLAYFVTMNATPEKIASRASGQPISPVIMLAGGLAVAAILAMAASVAKGRLLSDERLLAAAKAPPDGADYSGVADGDRPLAGAFHTYQAGTIIVAGLLESIALIGLFFVFITYRFTFILPFALIATALLLMSLPRKADLEERLGTVARSLSSGIG